MTEVVKCLKEMKHNKTTGLDNIDGYSLSLAMHHIAPVLCHITNLSIQQGKFPTCWKIFKTICIYKQKGDKCDSKNQRPVALLSVVSKVVENLVYKQVVNYLMENELFHPNHHGFRSNHSTATALLHLYDLWIKALDSGQFAAALMLDLSAGFDVVNHHILLSKLSMYGLDDLSVSWFKTYLTGRQKCRICCLCSTSCSSWCTPGVNPRSTLISYLHNGHARSTRK